MWFLFHLLQISNCGVQRQINKWWVFVPNIVEGTVYQAWDTSVLAQKIIFCGCRWGSFAFAKRIGWNLNSPASSGICYFHLSMVIRSVISCTRRMTECYSLSQVNSCICVAICADFLDALPLTVLACKCIFFIQCHGCFSPRMKLTSDTVALFWCWRPIKSRRCWLLYACCCEQAAEPRKGLLEKALFSQSGGGLSIPGIWDQAFFSADTSYICVGVRVIKV